MCLIVFANNINKNYKFILAGNRDEYYERKSLPFKWRSLSINDSVLAPKDLLWGGSWFGITKSGKIAFLTNYRNPSLLKDNAPSRGEIVCDYLRGRQSAINFIQMINPNIFNPFNLIFGNIGNLYYFSNITNKLTKIGKGIHGLSNHLLDSPWPKVKKAITLFKKIINETDNIDLLTAELFEILKDTTTFDKNLPHTGVGTNQEKVLSSIFVKSDNYGTQTSYILFVELNNKATLVEKNHILNTTTTFTFEIS